MGQFFQPQGRRGDEQTLARSAAGEDRAGRGARGAAAIGVAGRSAGTGAGAARGLAVATVTASRVVNQGIESGRSLSALTC